MSDTLCAISVAHGPHRWDTEDRTVLRNTCAGRTSNAEQVPTPTRIDRLRTALGSTFSPSQDQPCRTSGVWLERRVGAGLVRVVLTEDEGTEVHVFDVHRQLGHVKALRYSCQFTAQTPYSVFLGAVWEAVRVLAS